LASDDAPQLANHGVPLQPHLHPSDLERMLI
jgi:hypothetical protein